MKWLLWMLCFFPSILSCMGKQTAEQANIQFACAVEAFAMAIRQNDGQLLDKVEQSLSQGAQFEAMHINVNTQNVLTQMTLLAAASKEGRRGLAQMLIEQGATMLSNKSH